MGNKALGIADPGYDALRIRSGQSIAPDLGGGSTGAGGLENKIQVWHADGSAIDLFDADSAGFDLALTAAAAGDTVWLPSATISGNHTIAVNIRVVGISRGAVLSGTITVAGYLDHLSITGNLVINASTAQVEFVWVDHTGSGVNGVTMSAGTMRDTQITMRGAAGTDWGLYVTGGNDITRVTVDQIGGTSKGAYIDVATIGVYYCKFGGTIGGQVENALEVGWCWFDGSGTHGLEHTTTGIAYLHHCYFFAVGGDGLYVTATGLTLADCSWDSQTGLSLCVIGPGDRAAATGNAPLQVVASPHPGNLIDECVVRAYVNGKVYWSSHRAQGTSTALGYEYAYNTLTGVNAEIQSAAGKAGWKSVYNATDGLIYVAGQLYADSITYRSAIWTIDPATDTVTTHVMNAAGEATGDTNELVAILDDGTQLVTGERNGGGLTTGSDYPNGGGLWTIPKATIGTVSTYTRVYEDTASPTGEWRGLAKIGSTYVAMLIYPSAGKYKIQHSTNLTAWTVDIDGTALSLNDIRGNLAYSPARNKVYAVHVNASRQIVLHQYDGATWTTTTFSALVVPSTDGVDVDLAVMGSDLILLVGKNNTNTHDIYLITTLDTTPTFSVLYQDVNGTQWHGTNAIVGADMFYATNYPGGLNEVHLWSNAPGGSGTVTSVVTGTGLTGGPITTSGTISLNAALNDLTDVDTTGEATGDIIYDNAGTWQVYPLGIGSKITINANKLRLGNVSGGNYFEVDTTSGNVKLVGNATSWDDVRINADVVKAGATAPNWKAFGPSGNLQALMFEAGHHDEASFGVQMPHQWLEGSKIYPHVHWSPTTTDAGNVVWELEYSWANIGGTFGAPSNMATDATAAGGTAWVHKLTDLKSGGNNYIDGTGKTMSSMLMCRIHRNSNSGSDTLNKDVALLEVDFHFEIDSFGSDTSDVKDAQSAMFLESGDYLLLESGDNLLLE